MEYKYLKGSERDFEGAPDECTKIIVVFGTKYFVIGDKTSCGLQVKPSAIINCMTAERQPITEPSWDGVGLPPVGCECEFTLGSYETDEFDDLVGKLPWPGTLVTVVSHKVTGDGHDVAVIYWDEDGGGRAACFVSSCLKPIRSEADKKREEVIKAMRESLGHASGLIEVSNIYAAIASGKIPGVKLED